MKILFSFVLAFGLVVFLLGLQTLVFIPLSVLYEIWKRKFFKKWRKDYSPYVSVIIPAFNEENTIRPCIESILASDYPQFELIVINDGSTDNTEARIQDLIHLKKIVYLKTSNQGKARALNKGIELSKGDVIVYSDADSFFLSDTLKKLARWFIDPNIHGVCGNDTPIDPKTSLQKLLVITTHIGTGFVRRALSFISSLHIITGNLGAIRAKTLKSMQGFVPVWGEDMEITFRLQKARKKIIFDSEPIVLAECPGNIRNLWKQRIRWVRSYLKICRMHKKLFFSPKHAPFSFYLPLNFSSLVIVPILQLATFLILPFILNSRDFSFKSPWSIFLYSGLIYFFIISIYSCFLDKRSRDLRFLIPFGFLILPMSYFYNFVVLNSLFKELVRRKEHWRRIEKRNMDEILIAPRRRSAALLISIVIVFAIFISVLSFRIMNRPAYSPLDIPPGSILALASHFDAYEDWPKAINSVVNGYGKEMINTVGIGAGRMEWTYFKWKDHSQYWSNHQRGADQDLLLNATAAFHKRGWPVIAIIDLYAPNSIRENPDKAAVGFDGSRSTEQICFMELVNGEYGEKILEMVHYLAREYPIEAVDLTELGYNTFCYCDRCLEAYRSYSGREYWPVNRNNKKISKDHPSIGQWRSQLMAAYLKRIADYVHLYGKKLYVDVPVSWKNFKNDAQESGLKYDLVLEAADKIVVWNYFYLEGKGPDISQKLAAYLTKNFSQSQIIISIGLWGNDTPLSPDAMTKAAYYTLKNGINNLWLTPNHLMGPAHWRELKNLFILDSNPQANIPEN